MVCYFWTKLKKDTEIVIDSNNVHGKYVKEINILNMFNVCAIIGNIITVMINVMTKKQSESLLELNMQSSELSCFP